MQESKSESDLPKLADLSLFALKNANKIKSKLKLIDPLRSSEELKNIQNRFPAALKEIEANLQESVISFEQNAAKKKAFSSSVNKFRAYTAAEIEELNKLRAREVSRYIDHRIQEEVLGIARSEDLKTFDPEKNRKELFEILSNYETKQFNTFSEKKNDKYGGKRSLALPPELVQGVVMDSLNDSSAVPQRLDAVNKIDRKLAMVFF